MLIGSYLIFGRFLLDAWMAARTCYALTDGRALVLRTAFGSRLNTNSLNGEVRLSRQKGSRGTLEFGPPNPFRTFSSGIWLPMLATGAAFVDTPDVMQAYALATAAR